MASKTYIQIFVFLGLVLLTGQIRSGQEFIPPPPIDHNLIYMLVEQSKFAALPFEQGQTTLRADVIARSDKVGYIELKGEHSATVKGPDARVFLFTTEGPGKHPPFLVWLTAHRGARRVTAITERGLRGFAIASEEIIKPAVRVLARDGDMVFIELRPRTSLVPGEYAIIGDDVTRIATFRVMEASQH